MTDTTVIDTHIAQYKRFVPKDGANLVRWDSFEDDGEQMYLMGHFPDEASAYAALEAEKTRPDYNGDDLLVYLPEGVKPKLLPPTPEPEDLGSWEDWEREEEAMLRGSTDVIRTDYSPDQARDDKGRFSGGGGGGGEGGGSKGGGGGSESGSAGGSPNGPSKGSGGGGSASKGSGGGAAGGKSAKATPLENKQTIAQHTADGNTLMDHAIKEKDASKKADLYSKAAESFGHAAKISGSSQTRVEEHDGAAKNASMNINKKAAEAHTEAAKQAKAKGDKEGEERHTAAAKEHTERAQAQAGTKPGEKPDEKGGKGEHAHENGPKNKHGEGEPLKSHNGEKGTEKGTSGHIAGFIDFLNKPLEGDEGHGGGGEHGGGGGEGHAKAGAIGETASSKAEHAAPKGKGAPAVHHDANVERTDDWNEELHPRVPAGGPGGGQFGGGGGGGESASSASPGIVSSGGGGGGSNPKGSGTNGHAATGGDNPNAIVSIHRVVGAKPNVEKVLDKAGMPKEKLYSPPDPNPPDPARATERAALAKAMVMPVADGPKVPLDLAKHQQEAAEVRSKISPEHHDGLVKMSDGYDYTMKQLEIGTSPAKLAAGVESHWNSMLEKKGIDVKTLSPEDKAATYKQHFRDESGAAHVATAHEALKNVQDMFAKTPPTPGVVYRGMKNVTPEVMQKILNSKTMTLDSMSSFSFDHGVAHDYATGAQASKAAADKGARAAVFGEDKVMPNGVQVLMRVSHKSGVNMMGSSVYQKEREVLLPKQAKFRITGVSRSEFTPEMLKNGDPPHIVVDMEEI